VDDTAVTPCTSAMANHEGRSARNALISLKQIKVVCIFLAAYTRRGLRLRMRG